MIVHTRLEEEILYPACREKASDEELLDEAQVEHDSAKLLIADLMEAPSSDHFRDAKVTVLSAQIKHHVGEEEKPGDGIFASPRPAASTPPTSRTGSSKERRNCRGALQN